MQIFDLHFKPQQEDNKIISSSINEQENLYMAGELTKVLPQNFKLLDNLSSIIEQEHQKAGLRSALKEANQFLEKESKKGNVSWLGNLHFAVIHFKDYALSFTKAGDIKILLIRSNGELLDISESLDSGQTTHLKAFGNVAEGRIAQDDKLIILNQDLFSTLNQDDSFWKQIKQASDKKDIKRILKAYKPVLSEVSGVCLLLIFDEEIKPIKTKRNLPKFSFQTTFLKPVTKIKIPFKINSKVKLPSFNVKVPKVKVPKVNVPRKNLILVLILILILTFFFYIFKAEKERGMQDAKQGLIEAQSKITMAENFLIIQDEEKSQALFQEAWEILTPLARAGMPLRSEAAALRKSIKEFLK